MDPSYPRLLPRTHAAARAREFCTDALASACLPIAVPDAAPPRIKHVLSRLGVAIPQHRTAATTSTNYYYHHCRHGF